VFTATVELIFLTTANGHPSQYGVRLPACGFLLVFYSKHSPKMHFFWDRRAYDWRTERRIDCRFTQCLVLSTVGRGIFYDSRRYLTKVRQTSPVGRRMANGVTRGQRGAADPGHRRRGCASGKTALAKIFNEQRTQKMSTAKFAEWAKSNLSQQTLSSWCFGCQLVRARTVSPIAAVYIMIGPLCHRRQLP